MKFSSSYSSIIRAAGFAALWLVPILCHGQQIVTGNEQVRVEVRVATEQERKDLKNTSADEVTQYKTLLIQLSGKEKSPETRKGKWIAYGRSLKSNDLEELESGEFALDLSTNGQQKVESKRVSTSYTPEHAEVSRGGGKKNGGAAGGGGANQGGRGGNQPRAKKVAAEGKKFAGYGVIIKDGDKIVGRYFDPAGIEQEARK